MTKNITIGVAAILIVLGLFLPFGQESKTVVERVVNEPLGALNSPDLQIGGFRLYSQETNSFTATNTVICSLQSPAGTSTLIQANVTLTTATSAATNLSISRSSTNAAIGTVLSTTTVASGALASLGAGSTTGLFAPNTFLNVAQTGGGILTQSGNCQALWAVSI